MHMMMQPLRSQWLLRAALLLVAALAARPTAVQAQGVAPSNGCASILQAGVYRSFYVMSDTSPYAAFQQAACSLPSNDANELVLPLDKAGEAAFVAAAAVLVKGWKTSPISPSRPDFSASNVYKVVRDYHTATCKVSLRRPCMNTALKMNISVWQSSGGPAGGWGIKWLLCM